LSRTNSLTFQEELNPEKFQKAYLKAICTLKIPAHTGVPVRLGRTIGHSQNPMPSVLMAVTTISSMNFPCLFAQTGLLSPGFQGQVMILQNCSDEDITILRCSNIGKIENVKNPYFDNISEIHQNEWEIKVSQNAQLPEPETLSQEKETKFPAQAKINVPIEE
jgi:hypothetical protein